MRYNILEGVEDWKFNREMYSISEEDIIAELDSNELIREELLSFPPEKRRWVITEIVDRTIDALPPFTDYLFDVADIVIEREKRREK